MENGNYELIVYAIDHNHVDIVEFDNDTLFNGLQMTFLMLTYF